MSTTNTEVEEMVLLAVAEIIDIEVSAISAVTVSVMSATAPMHEQADQYSV